MSAAPGEPGVQWRAEAEGVARQTKQAIRERVWALLEERGVSRFPGARGRIPNFVGAERAADRLAEVEAWRRARTIKSNPDSPQRSVRLRALREGKIVLMAVPRLREAARLRNEERTGTRDQGSLFIPSELPLFRIPRRSPLLRFTPPNRPPNPEPPLRGSFPSPEKAFMNSDDPQDAQARG